MSAGRSKRTRRRLVALVALGVTVLALTLVLFPGKRLPIAFTLGTGIGKAALQTRIDALEQQAIRRATFSADDRAFLTDFYSSLATGAKLSVIVGQTGRLMDHYLEGSGASYRLDSGIFADNRKVIDQMRALRGRVTKAGCKTHGSLSSPEFYMPDPSKIDSVFGLYYGTLHVEAVPSSYGHCTLRWRAEVPWNWPSYESLKQKYGDYHAESFPLPNLKALLLGKQHALYVDNGLGEYLVGLGLAKPFLAFAEWEEEMR